MKRQIKFMKNWNNKLDNKIFSTIRKHTEKKEIYYLESEGRVFDVILKNQAHSKAVLLGFEVLEWWELREKYGFVLCLDTGLHFQDAQQIFRKFYKDFSETQKFMILIFEKVSETLFADQAKDKGEKL